MLLQHKKSCPKKSFPDVNQNSCPYPGSSDLQKRGINEENPIQKLIF
jgi:hypothetical protein